VAFGATPEPPLGGWRSLSARRIARRATNPEILNFLANFRPDAIQIVQIEYAYFRIF
jgi:hypothetical protein